MRPATRYFTLLAVLALAPTATWAQSTSIETLVGMPKNLAVVIVLPPEHEEYRRSLEVKTELRLRQSGFVVTGVADTRRFLRFEAFTMQIKPVTVIRGNVYTFRLYLREPVQLHRNGKFTFANVWESDFLLGYGPPESAESQIAQASERLLDQFLNDYLAANPRAYGASNTTGGASGSGGSR